MEKALLIKRKQSMNYTPILRWHCCFPNSFAQSLLTQTIRMTVLYFTDFSSKAVFGYCVSLHTTVSWNSREFYCSLVNLDNLYFLAKVYTVKYNITLGFVCLFVFQKSVGSVNSHAKVLAVTVPTYFAGVCCWFRSGLGFVVVWFWLVYGGGLFFFFLPRR